MGALCWSLFCCAVLCVLVVEIILMGTRELVALLKLSSWCLVTVSVLALYLAVGLSSALCDCGIS